MEKVEIEQRVKKIFSNLFNVSADSLTQDSSPDTIKNWDSLQHMNLVISVEEEFQISLGEEAVVSMLSFGLVVELVAEALEK